MPEEKDPRIAEFEATAKKMQGVNKSFSESNKLRPDGIAYQLMKKAYEEDENGNPVRKKDVNSQDLVDKAAEPFRKHLYGHLGWGDPQQDIDRIDPRTGKRVVDSVDKDFGIPAEDISNIVQTMLSKGFGSVVNGEISEPLQNAFMGYVSTQAQMEAARTVNQVSKDKKYLDSAQNFVQQQLGENAGDPAALVGDNLTSKLFQAMAQYGNNNNGKYS